jgi:hypothetical protein
MWMMHQAGMVDFGTSVKLSISFCIVGVKDVLTNQNMQQSPHARGQ